MIYNGLNSRRIEKKIFDKKFWLPAVIVDDRNPEPMRYDVARCDGGPDEHGDLDPVAVGRHLFAWSFS